MSHLIAQLQRKTPSAKSRAQLLALVPVKEYKDGRTKQCHRDECDIQKIMARYDVTGTISHLAKYEAVYADFSDFDFFEQTQKLTQGREVFDALPAEVRREFQQNPAKFFEFVNDPENRAKPNFGLPALAKPGQQLPRTASPDANQEAALAAASEPVASETKTKEANVVTPPAAGDGLSSPPADPRAA